MLDPAEGGSFPGHEPSIVGIDFDHPILIIQGNGFETQLIPAGSIREPRLNIPGPAISNGAVSNAPFRNERLAMRR